MQQIDHLAESQKEWVAFLSRKSHKVTTARGPDIVLQSLDSDGKSYRWILLATDSKSKTVTPDEHVTIAYHLIIGAEYSQTVYVVIRFTNEINKVLILPPEKVLTRKRILPRKSGIPWKR